MTAKLNTGDCRGCKTLALHRKGHWSKRIQGSEVRKDAMKEKRNCREYEEDELVNSRGYPSRVPLY